jgi:hypothetical protein
MSPPSGRQADARVDRDVERVVERGRGYVIAERLGPAGHRAESVDPNGKAHGSKRSRRGMRSSALDLYLQDHLAGATAGEQLARRMRKSHEGTAQETILTRIHAEIQDDRSELLRLMLELGVSRPRAKVAAGWLLEKVARLRPDARRRGRSHLARLIELEALSAGVTGKRSLWRSLRLAGISPTSVDLLDLETRAEKQLRALDGVREQVAPAALGAGTRQPS